MWSGRSNHLGWLSDQYLHTSASPPYAGADEAIDECGNNSFITLTNLGGISIPSAIDNSLGTYIPSSPGAAVGGTCSTTGYSSSDQHAVYGVTLAQFTSAYSIAKSHGMRLYILQTYVTKPKGDILYNAVWQPAGNTDELEDYGVSYSQLQTDDFLNSSKGYRLYILQSYVLPPSAGPLADMVRYNAVWRPGLFNFETDYGVTLSQYESDYGARFAAPQRLYSLQAYVQNAIFVFYNALWRLGITAEEPHYGLTGAQLASTNSTLSSFGWRLYLLQSYAVGTEPQLYDAVWRPGIKTKL